MARRITLPVRANALSYDDAEVADVLLELLATEQGDGVVIDDAQDTEPKARVRCRVMGKLVSKGVTIAVEGIDPDSLDAAGLDADDADEDGNITIDGLDTRTHVVPDGDAYLPVLSVKRGG